jgi:hypothetical protein
MRKKNGCVDSNFYRNAENEKEGDLGYHVIKISEHGVKVSKSDLKIHIGAFKGNSNGVNHCRKN